MDTVAAVLVLFPSGDSREEGELSEAEQALRGLPELDNDEADACGNVVFAYDDFRADPREWMKGKESDKAYPYWQRLAGDADQEPDADDDDPEEEDEDIDPDEGASPDAVEGVDPDELARALANMDPDGDGGHNIDDLLGLGGGGGDGKKPKKGKHDDDDPEWRAQDRDLKTREREARLAQGADKHRWVEEDRARKVTEDELRRREREQTLSDKQAREARTAEDHALRVEERRVKLAEQTPDPEPPKEHRVPRAVLGVLSMPMYLEALLKIRGLRKTQLEDPDPSEKLKAAKAIARKRSSTLKTRYETSDPKKLAVSRHLVELLSAIERGDDIDRPNWFEGNFVTGRWIAD